MKAHRVERLAEQIRIELEELIGQEVRDPRVGLVTVSRVEVTPDGRNAHVFVSVIGDENDEQQSLRGIRHALPFLRRSLAESLSLHHVPELHVELDRATQAQQRVEELLRRVKRSSD
jgi:ribosome-binding factor A